jgi:hypothetical protein
MKIERIIFFRRGIHVGEMDMPYTYHLWIRWYQSMFTKDLEEATMGKYLNREKLEELRDFNRKIQEES